MIKSIEYKVKSIGYHSDGSGQILVFIIRYILLQEKEE